MLSFYTFWVKYIYILIHNYVKKNIIVSFIIQKLRSKHTSLENYTNWAKLIFFLSFWGNERRKKPSISHLWYSEWILQLQGLVLRNHSLPLYLQNRWLNHPLKNWIKLRVQIKYYFKKEVFYGASSLYFASPCQTCISPT